MRLDTGTIDRLRIAFRPRAYLRLMPMAFADTPLGMGYGQTRFASPSRAYRVLYIGRTLAVSVAETMVRDRFVGKARRRLTIEEVEAWGIAEIAAKVPLSLLDLRTDGLVQLGVPTDVARAKAHRSGRRFGEALYSSVPGINGILYPSRLTGDLCIAVYDRAVHKLDAGPVQPVFLQPGLIPALAALNVVVLAG